MFKGRLERSLERLWCHCDFGHCRVCGRKDFKDNLALLNAIAVGRLTGTSTEEAFDKYGYHIGTGYELFHPDCLGIERCDCAGWKKKINRLHIMIIEQLPTFD